MRENLTLDSACSPTFMLVLGARDFYLLNNGVTRPWLSDQGKIMKDYSFPLLIVEDNVDDVELLRRVLIKAGTVNPVQIVSNGEEAIEYLSGEGQYANRTRFPLPRLMITDINMPRRGGFELLRWLRAHPQLQAVPILILTGSNSPKDIEQAFRGGVHGYFVKPSNLRDLQSMFQLIHNYWALSRTPEQKMMRC